MAKVTFNTHTDKAARLFLKFYDIEDKFKKNGGKIGLEINLISGSFRWYSSPEGHEYWSRYDYLWRSFYETGQITINEQDIINIYDIKYSVQKDNVDRWYLFNELNGYNSEIFAKLGLSSSNFDIAFPWQDSLKQLTETVCALLDKWYEIMSDDKSIEEMKSLSTIGVVNSIEETIYTPPTIVTPVKLKSVDFPWCEVERPITSEEADSFTYKPTKQTFKL